MLQKCTKCGQEKDQETEFYFYHSTERNKIRFRSNCKQCHNPTANDRRKVWYQNNRDLAKSRSRKCTLQRRYGLSSEEVVWLKNRQGHQCALCGRSLVGKRNEIEHQHGHCGSDNYKLQNGRRGCKDCIRGIVCSSCNKVIASVENYPDLVVPTEKLQIYLQQRPFKELL